MSNPIDQTDNLCQDCGGMHQRNADDIHRHYDRETGDIIFICINCQSERVYAGTTCR